ncbi:hypothetical protein DVH24_041019 [Malus domestica]|uniref:urease n=1 Tax=Malus domestica TaxID=3750 RepID=A0A498ICJ7_MALDO|nr:hypothetical protein DVH24_041019 [Malus domestica]
MYKGSVSAVISSGDKAAVTAATPLQSKGVDKLSASEGGEIQVKGLQEAVQLITVISREAYANMYGPTTGDRVRLGDTNLFAEIEKDFTVYGDESVLVGNTAKPEGMHGILRAGAMGLKLHEDWGSTPAAIDNCLAVGDQYDIQVNIHTDTLNESGYVEHTIAAFKRRTIHTYQGEGAGGGHAPDIIRVCGVKNVLPSSTNPTRPFTSNTIDEHLDILVGKLADLVLWKPSFFGAKPEMVIKGGAIAWANMRDPNASTSPHLMSHPGPGSTTSQARSITVARYCPLWAPTTPSRFCLWELT